MKRLNLFSLLVVMLSVSASVVWADVKMPAIFSNNMVLQRGISVPVWGWADAGEKITVTFNGQTKDTVCGEDGKWSLKLDAMRVGGPYEMTIAGNNKIAFGNVMLGDVWVASGQSNMQWTVKDSNNAAEEIKAADYPNIRLVSVPRVSNAKPQDNFEGTWVACSPETVPGFSAVAYYFGRTLHKETGVTIGLIHTSWGGSSCETWIPADVVEKYDMYKPIMERREAFLNEKPNGDGNNQHAGLLYNGMINPILPYGIKGAIWYQGESNAGRAYQYRTLFPLMIQTWREAWGQGEFPFYFVQLANYQATKEQPADDAWAELREAQTMTLSLPNTGQAVIIDIGEAKDIHPRNKQDVGYRLALWSLANDYGKRGTVFNGPMYRSMKIENDKATISFRFARNGLKTKDGGKVLGFEIAGADRKFVWADAVIDGQNVVVSSSEVPNPVAVRYAWATNPVCNLYNNEDLPACPFRTDMWPGVTINNR